MGSKLTGLLGLASLTLVTRPFGPAAARINELWWVMFWIAVVVCVTVFVFLGLALFRRPSDAARAAPLSVRFVVIAGAIVPAAILVGLLIYSLGTNRVLAAPPADEALTIEVIGHQWWWEVRYPESGVVSANEVIIPVGVPVRLELGSVDVIHSFWVPAPNGKMDLIPGQTTELPLEASQPGEYFGFCAEFCGVQHARMNLLVVARERADFDAWLAAQRQPAPQPTDAATREGQQVFLGSACVYCHTVRGTNASGRLGPDLTHLASRRRARPTEARPDAEADAGRGSASEASSEFERTWQDPTTGLAGWFATVNNNPLGARYMVTSLAFFLIAGVMGLFIRTQLIVPENTFLDPETYNQLFTMHGSTMMYLFVVPFLEGLANFILPPLLGARDLAYPRVTAFGYWLYLFGGLIFFSSFLVDSVPDAGWFAYTPLSGSDFSGLGMDFWLLGLGAIELGGIATGIELSVSILKLRAPGMTLGRMPLLAWSLLVMALAITFAVTVLLVATLFLELDRAAGTRFFDPTGGGNPLLWQHMFWIFGHPEVYIMFIPATGIVSMIVPTFARRPITAYLLVVLALIVTGFVSFALWAHHMFATGLPLIAASFFTAASFMIAVASGTQVFAWIATLWRSRPRFTTPLMFTLGFLFIFMLGGVMGVMVASLPLDAQVHDTHFVVAHFHYVLIGGAIMGSDPGNSVTNKYGQLWDAPNVFVTGAALYPQNPGMNPTGPLLALAYFAGEALTQRYFRSPRELLV